jgi:mannan endo-1,4-beta-mannosidase
MISKRRISGLVLLALCSYAGYSQSPIDSKATAETRALYDNLGKYAALGFMFGHQDGDAYGVNWKAVEGRSDVKEVCGSYPAIHGWDLGKIGGTHNIDSVRFTDMLKWIRQVYERGGVNTISWHNDNPVSGKNAWDKTPAVKDILPGGFKHDFFKSQLDLVAGFLNACKTNDGVMIPIIFRPFHEHNGDWFWWGKGNCSEEEYISLWRFTVNYLENEKGIHHLLWAISPDRSRMDLQHARSAYLYAYPGDAFVDILGVDDYADVGATWNKKSPEEKRTDFITTLKTVSALASEKKKVAALTETGMEGLPDPSWYTHIILDPVKATPDIHIAYALVWRNASPKHHYAPYPGHPAARDFQKFFDDAATFFESDLKTMYKSPARP